MFPPPPVPKKEEHVTQFGLVEDEYRGNDVEKLMTPPLCVKDNYYWMRHLNQDVLDHITNENAYTESIMKPHEELKKKLYEEVKSHFTPLHI